jgi:hypothetical protein
LAAEFGGELWSERMARLAERREQAYRTYLDRVEAAKKALDNTIEALDGAHESLVGLKHDQLVLARNTPGPRPTVYHSVEHPCGRVTRAASSIASFNRMLEGEARRNRLKRCTACGW